MLTGLGLGEAMGLGWEHVDCDTATLRVVRTVECKARTIVEDTKRPSRKRVVPLVPELRAILRERWMAAGRLVSGLVFATLAGRSTWTPSGRQASSRRHPSSRGATRARIGRLGRNYLKKLAEREGFEPPVRLPPHLISSQARSTGLRHLSVAAPAGAG